ncbi:hypothetical protein SCHPADRAFT_897944 [Schizopora paradoxa]|uniref:Uncharacterized protein n=1 Tax=Schizopora paradoxa TaxID=27342 RepID=A0A0H2SU84_9AGAM|nr:hypothetical protein SCHPADRAFT_897944 [Schizopora paradoxa]
MANPNFAVYHPGFTFIEVESNPRVHVVEGGNELDGFLCCEHCSRHTEETAQDNQFALTIFNPFVDEEERVLDLRQAPQRQRTLISFDSKEFTGNVPSAEDIFEELVSSGRRNRTAGFVDHKVNIPPILFMEVVRLLRAHLQRENVQWQKGQRGRPPQRSPTSLFVRSNSFP